MIVIINDCIIQTCHREITFSWLEENVNSFKVIKFYRLRGQSNKRYHQVEYIVESMANKCLDFNLFNLKLNKKCIWFNKISLGIRNEKFMSQKAK